MAIDQLLRWDSLASAQHRVHLHGNVTLQWPGRLLCIEDASRGICSQTAQNTQLAVGEVTDIVGFAQADNGRAVLTDASFRSSGYSLTNPAKAVTAEQALEGKNDSELVKIDGELINSDATSSDLNLVLSSGKIIFTAVIPKKLAGAEVKSWKVGSLLRVTGVCSVRLDVESRGVGLWIAETKSLRVLMRSSQDVTVVERPSWWTSGHALVVLGILATAILAGLGWIVMLRQRVRLQTEALHKAREEAATIKELARAMQEVAAQRKLSARVSASGSEQLAELSLGFNRMLEQLEEGDLAKRRAEDKLQQQALTDELTGLPNRRSLTERLSQSLALAERENRIVALLFIDLDGFKAINDNLGHAMGDLVLVEVTRRLQSRIRQADTLARLGGDEFTVVLTSLRVSSEAELVGANLLEVLSDPLILEGHEVTIGASIGISLYPEDATDSVTLLEHADSAMYLAKGNGKNQVRRFTSKLGSSVRERADLESQLRGAVARDEIHLHYQPEFDLCTHRLIRFEALARWNNPVLGSVSPGKFINVAEDSGQIVALGAFVLRTACLEAVKWQKLAPYPIEVAVNVSNLQFSRVAFVEEVAETLRETGLNPQLLQLELTEAIMLSGTERAAETMHRLRELGVGLAIDDFGTGYSCLSHLPLLPFGVFKIDRSYVEALTSGPSSRAIVSFLIELAHTLDMKVVVEGIETSEQLEIVKMLNGNEIQGFLVGRPTASPQSLLGRDESMM
jgi:diguanylate cyclase (GGDEF)-like protein